MDTIFRRVVVVALVLSPVFCLSPLGSRAKGDEVIVSPNVLTAASGARVRGLNDWPARRAELRERLLEDEYGDVPPAPTEVHATLLDSKLLFEGTARLEHFKLSWAEAPRFSVECGLIAPTTAGSHPVILAIDPVWQDHVRATAQQVVARGYVLAGLKYHDVDPDTGQRDVGIYPSYPDYSWRSIAAWAWAASRLVDYLVTRPEIDRKQIGVTGHSRCGKAAILAGALDDRFALVAPHCSGTGGAALYRVRNAGCETLAMITQPDRFHYWFVPGLRAYADREDSLPLDQHFLHALVAPRAFLSLEAQEDRWANPRGAWAACVAALPVFRLFDAEDRVAYAIRPGGHDPVPADWETLMDFADTIFRGSKLQNPAILRGKDLCKAPASLPAQATVSGTRLTIQGTRFVINDRPTFLLGISYYGALGASEDTIRQDLDEIQRRGFNWIRVWATWGAGGEDVSAVDSEGRAREPFLSRLKWLVAECDRRGVVVDVTLTRGLTLPTLTEHRQAVETIVTALKPHANWYLDLANERNVGDRRHVDFGELAELRQLVRRLDPTRLVTASSGGDISRDALKSYLQTAQVDFVTPHRPRNAKSPSQTQAVTQELLGWMKALGREVPVLYQEPFRRGYSKRWQPTAEDFATDLSQAIAGKAAGWCFHNGDQRGRADRQPGRSFDLRHRRLFEQLDDQEKTFLDQRLPAVMKRSTE